MLDIGKNDLEQIFSVASKLDYVLKDRTRLKTLDDKIMASLFFQPSTRTRLSFESAMIRLGGSIVGFADAKVSRAGDAYGESLEDTSRMINNYADVVAMRHSESGAPRKFSEHANIPVINAGDGSNEHPTQAMLDLYTIVRERGDINDMNVMLIGDMNQRAVHSLAYGLAKYKNVTLYSVYPDEAPLPDQVQQNLKRLNMNWHRVARPEEAIGKSDVVYVIFSKKSVTDPPTREQLTITLQKLKGAKPNLLLMHPLPRMDELPTEVDTAPYGRYFMQPYYGVLIRMALLLALFGREDSI
jgi:aspartate carbamoyltransferase catalytic subunit